MENLTVRQFMNQYSGYSKEYLIARLTRIAGKLSQIVDTLDELDESTKAWKELSRQLRSLYVEHEIIKCILEELEEENE